MKLKLHYYLKKRKKFCLQSPVTHTNSHMSPNKNAMLTFLHYVMPANQFVAIEYIEPFVNIFGLFCFLGIENKLNTTVEN